MADIIDFGAYRDPADMDALSGDRHRHLIGPGHQGAGAGIDRSLRQAGPQVQAEDARHAVVRALSRGLA